MTRNSSKVSLLLARVIVFYFIILGVLPFKYNAAQHTLETSRWILVYSIFIHFFAIGALLFQISQFYDYQSFEALTSGTFLTKFVQLLQSAVCAVTLTVTLFKQWIGRKALVNLITDAQLVGNSYLNHKKPVSSKFFDHCVIARSFLVLAQMGSNLYAMFGLHKNSTEQFYLFLLLVAFLYNAMFAIETQYYLGILYLCRHLDQLKSDLNKINALVRSAKDASINPSSYTQLSYALVEKVDLLASTHCKLTRLGRQLTVFFQWQIVALMTSILTATTFSGYAFVVYLRGKFMEKDLQTSLILPQYMIINILSFMLNICICQRKFNLTQDIRQNLKELTEISCQESHLCKSVRNVCIQPAAK